jgi:hypothetical protein
VQKLRSIGWRIGRDISARVPKNSKERALCTWCRTYDLGLLAGLLGEELAQGNILWLHRGGAPHLRLNLVLTSGNLTM